jgi:hypothetical protein
LPHILEGVTSSAFSIDSQVVFSNGFILGIKHLVLLELDVANSDNLAVPWNGYAIDVAAAIANEVADVRPGFGLAGNLFLAFQNLFPNRISSANRRCRHL